MGKSVGHMSRISSNISLSRHDMFFNLPQQTAQRYHHLSTRVHIALSGTALLLTVEIGIGFAVIDSTSFVPPCEKLKTQQ